MRAFAIAEVLNQHTLAQSLRKRWWRQALGRFRPSNSLVCARTSSDVCYYVHKKSGREIHRKKYVGSIIPTHWACGLDVYTRWFDDVHAPVSSALNVLFIIFQHCLYTTNGLCLTVHRPFSRTWRVKHSCSNIWNQCFRIIAHFSRR